MFLLQDLMQINELISVAEEKKEKKTNQIQIQGRASHLQGDVRVSSSRFDAD